MIEKIGNSLDLNSFIELYDDTTNENVGLSESAYSNNMMYQFNAVTTDLLIASSTNRSNTSSPRLPAPVVSASNNSYSIATSNDGKLSSPIAQPVLNSSAIDDFVVEKSDDNGNTIKLGNFKFKDTE